MGRQSNSQSARAEPHEDCKGDAIAPNHHHHRHHLHQQNREGQAAYPLQHSQGFVAQRAQVGSSIPAEAYPSSAQAVSADQSCKKMHQSGVESSSSADGFPYDAVEKQLLLSRHSSSDDSPDSAASNADIAAGHHQGAVDNFQTQVAAPPNKQLPFYDSGSDHKIDCDAMPSQVQAQQQAPQPRQQALRPQQCIQQFEQMVQKYAKKLLLRNKGMSQQQATSRALKRIVYKLDRREGHQGLPHDASSYKATTKNELIKQFTSNAGGSGFGAGLSDDSAKSVLDLRNTIDRLGNTVNNQVRPRIMPNNSLGNNVDQNHHHHQILAAHDGAIASEISAACPTGLKKSALVKPPQYALSKAYYDKFGFKMVSSSSSSANGGANSGGGSGGHSSSDDQMHNADSIALLKKRKFRDFQTNSIAQVGLSCTKEQRPDADMCDEMKLLKLLEQERKKKAKFTHGGLLVGQSGAADYHHHHHHLHRGSSGFSQAPFYSQRGKECPSLKRKRSKMVQQQQAAAAAEIYSSASEYKQRFFRRKEAESSSD